MSTFDVGDEVLTNGGIVGTITFIEDDWSISRSITTS